MVILDSYEKAAQDILRQLEKNPNIFVIKSFSFKLILAIIYDYSSFQKDFSCFEQINIITIAPTLLSNIQQTLPFPNFSNANLTKAKALAEDFVMELISQYAISWIPIESFLYKQALESDIACNTQLKDWQRYVRASYTDSEKELMVLLTDCDERVRNRAIKRLKAKSLKDL